MTAAPRWTFESRPRLRRGVLVVPADGGRWQVRWDFDMVVFLSGKSCDLVLPWLIPCLDGHASLETLEERAIEKGCERAFREVIDSLTEQRLLEDVAGTANPASVENELTAAIGALGSNGAAIARSLAETSVVVIGRSPLSMRISESLYAQGFHRVSLNTPEASLPENAFAITVETDCSLRQLEQINRWALSGRRSWMLIGAWNRRALVGPIFIPGETACYDCYRKRLASHRAHLEAYRALEEWRLTHPAPALPEPVLPAIAQVVAAYAALELFHFMTGLHPPRTVGRVMVYDLADADLTTETVLRIPWCEGCASVATISPATVPHSFCSSPLT